METEVSSIESSSHKSKPHSSHSLSKSNNSHQNESNSNSDFEEKNLSDSKTSKKNVEDEHYQPQSSKGPVKRVTLYADKVRLVFFFLVYLKKIF